MNSHTPLPEDNYSFLSVLPIELHWDVFDFLSGKELRELRLVCTMLNNEIEAYYSYSNKASQITKKNAPLAIRDQIEFETANNQALAERLKALDENTQRMTFSSILSIDDLRKYKALHKRVLKQINEVFLAQNIYSIPLKDRKFNPYVPSLREKKVKFESFALQQKNFFMLDYFKQHPPFAEYPDQLSHLEYVQDCQFELFFTAHSKCKEEYPNLDKRIFTLSTPQMRRQYLVFSIQRNDEGMQEVMRGLFFSHEQLDLMTAYQLLRTKPSIQYWCQLSDKTLTCDGLSEAIKNRNCHVWLMLAHALLQVLPDFNHLIEVKEADWSVDIIKELMEELLQEAVLSVDEIKILKVMEELYVEVKPDSLKLFTSIIKNFFSFFASKLSVMATWFSQKIADFEQGDVAKNKAVIQLLAQGLFDVDSQRYIKLCMQYYQNKKNELYQVLEITDDAYRLREEFPFGTFSSTVYIDMNKPKYESQHSLYLKFIQYDFYSPHFLLNSISHYLLIAAETSHTQFVLAVFIHIIHLATYPLFFYADLFVNLLQSALAIADGFLKRKAISCLVDCYIMLSAPYFKTEVLDIIQRSNNADLIALIPRLAALITEEEAQKEIPIEIQPLEAIVSSEKNNNQSQGLLAILAWCDRHGNADSSAAGSLPSHYREQSSPTLFSTPTTSLKRKRSEKMTIDFLLTPENEEKENKDKDDNKEKDPEPKRRHRGNH